MTKKLKKRSTPQARRRNQLRDLKALVKSLEQDLSSANFALLEKDRFADTLAVKLENLEAAKTRPFIWIAGDGRRMLPSEMDEQHLRNTISYLQRTLTRDFGTVPYLNKLTKRVQAFHEMLKEAESRGFEV